MESELKSRNTTPDIETDINKTPFTRMSRYTRFTDPNLFDIECYDISSDIIRLSWNYQEMYHHTLDSTLSSRNLADLALVLMDTIAGYAEEIKAASERVKCLPRRA